MRSLCPLLVLSGASIERTQSFGLKLFLDISISTCWVGKEGERDIPAIVATVVRCVGSPCRKSKVTVSTVPVDGDQVMFIGVPAVMEVRVVKEKGFWAVVRAASVAMTSDVYVE
jgi:hypothetical protein